jgi:hypothetical protein
MTKQFSNSLKGSNMRKLRVIFFVFALIFLVGCSGPPRKLLKTADYDMLVFMAQNSNITEDNLYIDPLLVDEYQVTEDKWCLTYEIGHLLRFSTMWEKQDREWVQTEIRPYVENCNWAR